MHARTDTKVRFRGSRPTILAVIALCCSSAAVVATPYVAAADPSRELAPSGSALTLQEAVARALESGPSAQIARLEADRAREEAAAAESIYWPHASITSQAGYTNRLKERFEAVDSDGNVHEYGLGSIASNEGWFNFMVHQIVFDLGRWKQAERAGLEAEVAALAEAQRREVASFDVLEAYVNVLRFQALLANQHERVVEVERLDERAESILGAGRGLATERSEVALYLSEVRLELLARQDQVESARRALALLIGDETPTWTVTSTPLREVDADFEAPADEVEASPEVRLLELRRNIEQLQLEAARAGRYPVVALGGGYTHYGAYRYDNFTDEVRVGVDFRLPLFEGFRHQHSIEGAQKGLAAATVRYESLLASKRARVQALAAGLDAAIRSAELLAERQRLGSERIRLATLALDTQRGSMAVALAARREVDAVVDASVAARYQPILLWAEIMREAGQLSTALSDRPHLGEDG